MAPGSEAGVTSGYKPSPDNWGVNPHMKTRSSFSGSGTVRRQRASRRRFLGHCARFGLGGLALGMAGGIRSALADTPYPDDDIFLCLCLVLLIELARPNLVVV